MLHFYYRISVLVFFLTVVFSGTGAAKPEKARRAAKFVPCTDIGALRSPTPRSLIVAFLAINRNAL